MSLLSLVVAAILVWPFVSKVASWLTSTAASSTSAPVAAEPAAATPAPAPESAQLTCRSSVTRTLEDMKPSPTADARQKKFEADRESAEKERLKTKAQTEDLRQKGIALEAR